MAIIQNINVSTPNDGLGDSLRTSQVKANANFEELNLKKVEVQIGRDLSDVNFSQEDKDKLDSLQNSAGNLNLIGKYNATTNIPELTNATGNIGDIYEVTVGGAQDFGDGIEVVLVANDFVYKNIDGKYRKFIDNNQTDGYVTDAEFTDFQTETSNKFLDVENELVNKADLIGGLVPSSQLPSFVDDVLEFANLASFPVTGELGKIYIAISPKNLQYRWSGSNYIAITNGLIASTNDVPDSTNKRYVTDAQLTVLGNTSGTNTGDNATNTTSNAYADSKVSDAIVDGVTTVAPSQNAVFDALALKENAEGYLTIVSSATPVTLTASSPKVIVVTGTVVQTINLPVVSTLTLGHKFVIVNLMASQNVNVTSSGVNAFGYAIHAGLSNEFVCISTTGTTTASWTQLQMGSINRTGNGSWVVHSIAPVLSIPSYTVNANFTAGTNVQGQGTMTTDVIRIATTGANPSGVTLMSANFASKFITVVNNGTNPVNIYPLLGESIDGLAANMPIQIPVGGVIRFNSVTSTSWRSDNVVNGANQAALNLKANLSGANFTGAISAPNIGAGIVANIAAYIATAINTASVGQIYFPPSAIDYAGTLSGMLWNNASEWKFYDGVLGSVNRLLKLNGNSIFANSNPLNVVTSTGTGGNLGVQKLVTAFGRFPTAVSYTILLTDVDFGWIIAVTNTSVARTITFPLANTVPAGFRLTIKDESGGAGTNNITLATSGSDTTDATAINTNGGSRTVYSDGISKWFTI